MSATNTTHSTLLHFDSIYGTYQVTPNASSGVSASPYACSWTLPSPIKKPKRIWLKSAEIPVTFCNISKGTTDTYSFILNGTTYTATLTEKLYTSIAMLITDINIAVTSLGIGATTPIMSLSMSSSTPYRIWMTSTGSTLSIVNTNLSKYILGLRSTDTFSGSWLYGGANYDLAIDNYLSFYIPTITAQSCQNVNGAVMTFKIPLNASNNSIFYYMESTGFPQKMEIGDPNFVLNTLTVYVKDRFGMDVNPQGGDFSFTLQVDYNI